MQFSFISHTRAVVAGPARVAGMGKIINVSFFSWRDRSPQRRNKELRQVATIALGGLGRGRSRRRFGLTVQAVLACRSRADTSPGFPRHLERIVSLDWRFSRDIQVFDLGIAGRPARCIAQKLPKLSSVAVSPQVNQLSFV